MGLPVLAVLGILMNFPQGLQTQDVDVSTMLHKTQVTGVLGEEVHLSCLYTGPHVIVASSWNRMDSSRSSSKMAGFKYDGTSFGKGSFSSPSSVTNLTVKVAINNLDMEGQYTCVFTSDETETKESFFLRVIAQPDITTHMDEEVVDGSQYQVVSCTASHAKPQAQLSWEMPGSSSPPGDIFSITTTNSTHHNGTTSTISLLRFPILLNSESSITCVVQHPALTEPSRTEVKLQTFSSPTVTMETRLTQREGEAVVEVRCRATGGRPRPDITWVLPGSADVPPPQGCGEEPQSVSSCRWFPPHLFEGENVTCVFGYSLLPAAQTRTVSLPTYHLTSLQLKGHGVELNSENTSSVLTLEEGDRDIVIGVEVLGNVPRYEISCNRVGEDLLDDMDVIVVGSELYIKGPVKTNLASIYQCQASYHKHTAALLLQIRVNPRILLPVSFPPNISVNLREEGDNIYVECLASDGSPAANMSWVLPQELNTTVKSDITSSNGSFSVRSILTLPPCWPQDLLVQCVVEHPDLPGPETRRAVFPPCVRVSMALRTASAWENGVAHVVVECRAHHAAPEAAITWTAECQRRGNASEPDAALRPAALQERKGAEVWSTVHLPALTHAGCTVICELDQDGLKGQMRKVIDIPLTGPSESHLSVGPQRDSTLWAAVCTSRADAVTPNISWVFADHSNSTVLTSTHTKYEGATALVTSMYQFYLSQHEGEDLTCVVQNNQAGDVKRTVHIPKYFLSSIEVLNSTVTQRGNRGHHSTTHRVALQAGVPHQRVVFKVNGNTPEYTITCFRADGSAAVTVATALVFAEPVSERDAGLYMCDASWNHHTASVFVQVDVSSQETLTLIFTIICFSSATAIILILIIPLCVFCKRSGGRSSAKDRKKRESLAALMQDPRSPDLKKAALGGGSAQEYAELVRYSIVIDVKSTV